MADTGKAFGSAAVRKTPGSKPKEPTPKTPWPKTGTLELIRATPPPEAVRNWVSVHLGTFVHPFPTLLAGKKFARNHGSTKNPATIRGGWPAKTLFVYPEKS